MDQSFLGLCLRFYIFIYSFIIKCITTYAKKSVTLGHAPPQASAQLPSSGSMAEQATHAVAQETVEPEPAHNHENVQAMGDGTIPSGPSEEEKNEEEVAVSAIAPEAQPPKKMVSINETVEEMVAIKKKSKKKKRTEKMGSFDQEIEEPKPLKSILKVGSKADENSYMNPSSNLGSS